MTTANAPHVLVVNCGSSSLKLALVGNVVLWSGSAILAGRLALVDLPAMLRTAFAIVFAGSFMTVSVYLLRSYAHFALLIPFGAVVYAVALVGMGGVTTGELRTLVAVFLRRGKKISDIVSS